MSEVSHCPTPRVGVDFGMQDAAVPIMRQVRSEQPIRQEMQRRASSVPAVASATPRVLVRMSTEEAYEQCFNIQRTEVPQDRHAHQAMARPVSPPRHRSARTSRGHRRFNSEEVVRDFLADEPSSTSVPDTSHDST